VLGGRIYRYRRRCLKSSPGNLKLDQMQENLGIHCPRRISHWRVVSLLTIAVDIGAKEGGGGPLTVGGK
jgi:hypothetical protein